MGCCSRSPGVDPAVHVRIRKKLDAAAKIYPNTSNCCIVTPNGKVLAHAEHGEAVDNLELVALVSSLKHSASGASPSVVHVQGARTLFSLYDVGDNVLVMYSHLPDQAALLALDTESGDAQLKPILEDLAMLTQNAVPAE